MTATYPIAILFVMMATHQMATSSGPTCHICRFAGPSFAASSCPALLLGGVYSSLLSKKAPQYMGPPHYAHTSRPPRAAKDLMMASSKAVLALGSQSGCVMKLRVTAGNEDPRQPL